MAKIKVHELAKELDKQSKEILAFLQEKGIEAKAAQSSIEEEDAKKVRVHFGTVKAEPEQTPVNKEQKTEETKTEAKSEVKTEEAPKKKKKIIISR